VSEDLSHDAHLRAALRHAPDHALAPPAGVSQTILNAARQLHKPTRPAATPAPAVRITVAPPRAIAWLRLWFASPRLAGGLATGLVAALGLGLWIDLGREPVVERAPLGQATDVRSSDAIAAAPPALEPSGPSADDRRKEHAAAHQPAAKSAQTTSRARLSADASVAQLMRNVEPAPHEAPAARTAPPERRENRVARESEDASGKMVPPAAVPPAAARAPTPAPRPEPAVVAAKAAPAPPESSGTAPLATAQATTDAQQRATVRSDSRMSSAAGRAAAVAGAQAAAIDGAAAAEAAASPAATLLRRSRSETASGHARWTWMPPGRAAIVPLDEAGHEWLTRVAQAARERWTDTTERAGPGNALEVRWWRDDWPQGTLRLEVDGMRWIEHNGRTWRAPLDQASLQRLRGP
jgi:hypothetical protein